MTIRIVLAAPLTGPCGAGTSEGKLAGRAETGGRGSGADNYRQAVRPRGLKNRGREATDEARVLARAVVLRTG